MDRERRKKIPERVLTRDSLQEQDETVTMINQAICQEQRARLCANNVLLPTLRACSRLRDHQLDAFRTVGWCSLGCSNASWHRNYFNLSIYTGITVTNYYPLQLSSSGYMYFRKFNLDTLSFSSSLSTTLQDNIYANLRERDNQKYIYIQINDVMFRKQRERKRERENIEINGERYAGRTNNFHFSLN